MLQIIHWIDGRLTVIGCVEHTGHRMGTALLRLSSSERIVLDEYLYVVDEKVPLDTMLDRIRGSHNVVVVVSKLLFYLLHSLVLAYRRKLQK